MHIVRQGSHYGGDTGFDEMVKGITGSFVHISYVAVVNAVFDGTLVGLDDVGIGTCKTECIHAVGLQTGYKVLVHQSAIDHRDHLKHLGIGDAAAIDHLRLNAELFGYLCSTPSTAMHQHFLAGYG